MLTSCQKASATWLLPLLLALPTAGHAEKDTCSPSLLQISSSVHGAGYAERVLGDCSDSSASSVSEALPHVPRGHHLTLLQVAAKTGEVTQYKEDQHDEDTAESSKPDRPHTNLLSRDSGTRKERSADSERSGADSEKRASSSESANESEETDSHSDSGKPKAEVATGARIAPFGKEDTARELQHHAASTQDTLVDAIENAEVAEIKRSIFRSLTRLRAAEIKEFDTIARLETQAIDEYNDNHHYRKENELKYIHDPEDEVQKDKYTSFHD